MLHRFMVLTGYWFCLILFLSISCLIVHVLPLIHALHPSCFLVSICWKENPLTQAWGQYVNVSPARWNLLWWFSNLLHAFLFQLEPWLKMHTSWLLNSTCFQLKPFLVGHSSVLVAVWQCLFSSCSPHSNVWYFYCTYIASSRSSCCTLLWLY